MKSKLLILIACFFLLYCKEKKNNDYQKQFRLFHEYSQSYVGFSSPSLDLIENKQDVIDEILNRLDKLEETSTTSSEEKKYFYDLMRFRIYLSNRKKKKALQYLNSIKTTNPMFFNFCKGATYELLDNNKEQAVVMYKASKKCSNDPLFCIWLDYFITEDTQLFLKELKETKLLSDEEKNLIKSYDLKYNNYRNDSLFRRDLILSEIFTSYILPN